MHLHAAGGDVEGDALEDVRLPEVDVEVAYVEERRRRRAHSGSPR
jgi:hypothetical protein